MISSISFLFLFFFPPDNGGGHTFLLHATSIQQALTKLSVKSPLLDWRSWWVEDIYIYIFYINLKECQHILLGAEMRFTEEIVVYGPTFVSGLHPR